MDLHGFKDVAENYDRYLEVINVSDKVVKIIQSYVGVVNKMVWRKDVYVAGLHTQHYQSL
jgi:hypothetical protein